MVQILVQSEFKWKNYLYLKFKSFSPTTTIVEVDVCVPCTFLVIFMYLVVCGCHQIGRNLFRYFLHFFFTRQVPTAVWACLWNSIGQQAGAHDMCFLAHGCGLYFGRFELFLESGPNVWGPTTWSCSPTFWASFCKIHLGGLQGLT